MTTITITKEKLIDTMDKLTNILSKENLMYEFDNRAYPITLTIMPIRSPANQLSMSDDDDGGTKNDAQIKFVFEDGEITIKTSSEFVIPEALMNKVKGMAKKIHYLFLQDNFEEMDKLKRAEAEKVRRTTVHRDRIVPVYETTVGTMCLIKPRA